MSWTKLLAENRVALEPTSKQEIDNLQLSFDNRVFKDRREDAPLASWMDSIVRSLNEWWSQFVGEAGCRFDVTPRLANMSPSLAFSDEMKATLYTRQEKHACPATIELESNTPQGSTVMAELAKCVEHAKDALAGNPQPNTETLS